MTTPRPVPGDPSMEQVEGFIDAAHDEWWLIDGEYTLSAAEIMQSDGSGFDKAVLLGLPLRRNKGTDTQTIHLIVATEVAQSLQRTMAHTMGWITAAEVMERLQAESVEASTDDPRFLAAIDLLHRTGAHSFQMRFSDDEDPIVWLTVVEYFTLDGMPVSAGTEGAERHWEAEAAPTLLQALFRLCARMIDGGTCMHCRRPTLFSSSIEPPPVRPAICWSFWNPEAGRFARSCQEPT